MKKKLYKTWKWKKKRQEWLSMIKIIMMDTAMKIFFRGLGYHPDCCVNAR